MSSRIDLKTYGRVTAMPTAWGLTVVKFDFFFSNWHPGEPNNGSKNQDCAKLGMMTEYSHNLEDYPMKSYGNYQFQCDDFQCNQKLSFACEGNLTFRRPGA